LGARPDELGDLAARILTAIAQHRVRERLDRYEPRARKRRYDNLMHLERPRRDAQTRLLKESRKKEVPFN
jgi:hypothetical protein